MEKLNKRKQKPIDKPASTSTSRQPVEQDLSPDSDQSHQKKPVTVIAGDSIIQRIPGWDLSKGKYKVVVKSFSGATIDDMDDFVRPITRKEPENTILHTGTNDLRSSQTAQLIAESLVNLADQIVADAPNTKLSISAILYRKDADLWSKAQKVNKTLKRFCSNRGWSFLANDKINNTCLNRSGLHLNSKGVSELTKIYYEHLN